MARGSSRPLIETSASNLPGGKERPARKADNFTAFCEPTVRQCGSLDVSHTYQTARPVAGIALPFLTISITCFSLYSFHFRILSSDKLRTTVNATPPRKLYSSAVQRSYVLGHNS
jgi:hypothetical protein